MSITTAIRRGVLTGLHRVTVLSGIVLFPFVLVAERIGLRIPMERLLTRLHEASRQV